jgi:D-mannonate dehydratase
MRKMKFKIETIENLLPPKQQLLKRFQQQEEYLQARMREPIQAATQAEPFPSWETWFGDLDLQLHDRLKNRPTDEIRRVRRQFLAELGFLLDIQEQLEQFVNIETEKIWANLIFFVKHVVPLTRRLDISLPHRQSKRCRSMNASHEQQKMAVRITEPTRDKALREIELQVSRVRWVMHEVARRFFDGHVPLLGLAVGRLDSLQTEVDFFSLQLGSGHVMDDPRKTIEEGSSQIETEISDVVESMKDNAEIAMYNALGEPDMARTQASKQLKRDSQVIQKYLEQLKKQLGLTQKKG